MEWKPGGSKRLSRRRFLAAAGVAAGAGGLLAAGCGGGADAPARVATKTVAPGRTAPAGTGTATTAPREPLSKRHGDTLRYTNFVASDRVWDPHKTQAGPYHGQQALVFSRLLTYSNQVTGAVLPDLAASYLQPDATTIVFQIEPAARWQEREPLNGRPVTAEDVKFSIERQVNGDASFVRKARWLGIDKVEAPDPRTVRITLKSPLVTMLGAFADVNAFIVAPELEVGGEISLEQQTGSGPFRWVEWQEGKFASVARNPSWFGRNQRPYLDGLDVTQPKNTDEIEAGLRTKNLDVAFLGKAQADRLQASIPQLQATGVGHGLWFGMRFNTRIAPFNDPRVRQAFSIAVNRHEMLQAFFSGAGAVNPWVSWPFSRWTLPESEVLQTAGYRPGVEGRAQDMREAKALIEAAVGAGVSLPDMTLFVVDEAEYNLNLGMTVRRHLLEATGIAVGVTPVPIGDLVGRILKNEAGWAAGPDTGWIDLDDWLHPYFHSAGTKNTFALRDTELDALIDGQRTEFDEGKRRELGFQAQRKIMTAAAGVNFVSERVVSLAYPYVKAFPHDAVDGYQDRFADTWLDRDDPTFRGRSSVAARPTQEPAR